MSFRIQIFCYFMFSTTMMDFFSLKRQINIERINTNSHKEKKNKKVLTRKRELLIVFIAFFVYVPSPPSEKHHRKNIQHKKSIYHWVCLNKKCQQQHFILYLFVAPTFAWEGNKILYVFLNNNKHIFLGFFITIRQFWEIINRISPNMENAFRLYTYLYTGSSWLG